MNLANNKSMGAALWICLVSVLCIYFIPWFVSTATLSPDELNYEYASRQLASEGEFAIGSDPGDLRFYGFIPRSFGYNRHGSIAPYGSPGYIYALAALRNILPKFFLHLFNPLLLLLCAYILYRIGSELSLSKTARQVAAVLFLTMPVVVNQACSLFPDVINLLLFLYAVYLLAKMDSQPAYTDLILFFLVAAGMCWIRQTSAIFVLGFAIFIFLRRWNMIRIKYVPSIFLGLLIIAALLSFSKVYFGGYFKTGLTGSDHIAPLGGVVSRGPSGLNRTTMYIPLLSHLKPGVLINHFRFLPAALLIAFPVVLFSLLGMLRRYRQKAARDLLLLTCILLVAGLLFFGNFETYGYGMHELNLHSSFLRYMLPGIALLPLWAVAAIPKVWSRSRMFLVAVAVNLAVAVAGPYGVAEMTMTRIYFDEVERFIKTNTTEKSVVFTCYWDKLIYPERQVFTMHTRHRYDEEVLLEIAEAKGYDIYYIENPLQENVQKYMNTKYSVKTIEGPELSNPLLQMMPPPRKLYPVRLVRLKERKANSS